MPCPQYPYRAGAYYAQSTVDFNGDGLSDFCFSQTNDESKVVNTTLYTYYATGDGLFRAGYTPFGYGDGGYKPAVHGDFNGDGKSDFLLANYDDETGTFDPDDIFIFKAKPDIPDLLTSISNNRGGEVAIEYEPSSKYKNKDGIDPDINPRIPFIVQTVSSITFRDGLENESENEYTTNYEYGDAKFDYDDRDFRGFRWAKTINPDGTSIKAEFHQDKFRKGRQKLIENREYYTDNETTPAPLLSKNDFVWAEQQLGDTSKFVSLTTKYATMYESGSACFTTYETYKYWDYVELGNNAHGGIKEIRTNRIGVAGERLITSKNFQNLDSSNWVWRMTEEAMEGYEAGLVRKTEYDYESLTGNLISKKLCLDENCDTGSTIAYEYDDYGNLVKETDPLSHFTEMFYDEDTETYPVEIYYPQTGAVTHNIYKQYDRKFGTVQSQTDENGNTTTYQFDPFGRVTETHFPPDGDPDGGRGNRGRASIIQ